MAIKDCIDEIRALAGDELSAQDVEEIATEVQRRAAAKKRADRLLSDADALIAAAEDVTADMRAAAMMEARNRAINVLVRKRNEEFVGAAVKAGLRPDQAVMALNVGINRYLPGGRLSVDARQKGMLSEFLGGLVADLEREKLLEFLTRRLGLLGSDAGVVDRDIARALWSIDDSGKATADLAPEIKRIAEIIHKHQEAVRLRTNRAGAFIRKMPGYIVRQSHDQAAIARAGLEQWTAFIRPLLDAEKTFGVKDPEAFLKATYFALSSGEHIKSRGATDDLAFRGPGNLAKKLSEERVLNFKDADSWFAYNEKFGTKSMIEAVLGGMERGARDISLMETWGTNPEAEFKATIERHATANRDKPDWVKRLRDAKLANQFAEVDGTTRQVNNITLAHVSSGVRAAESMAKLGGATISSITDLPTAAAELRWQGENLGSAYGGLLSEAVSGRSNAEARALSAEIGVGMEGVRDAILSRFGASDGVSGTMAKLQRLFFKLNLLSGWTDAVKTGAGRMMAWRAAQQTKRGWGGLDPRFRSAISQYGIDEPRWEVIRKAALRGDDSREYLTAKAIRELPDDAFAGLGAKTERQTQRFRDELSTALQSFYSDRVDFAVVTPGARETAIIHQGTQRGTWVGEGLRFVMQFKAFPIAFATKVFGRDLGGYGIREALLQGKGDLLGLAHVIAGTTVMGMIALQAKELLKGKNPRDPFGGRWAETWTAAFTQGGGLGIYGDFLLGENDRYGQDLLSDLAGPTFGIVNDVSRIRAMLFRKAEGAIEGQDTQGDIGASLLRLGVNNAPFVNLFYTRIALDYLVLYQLQEIASPGHLRRTEQRLKREQEQSFFVPPSSVIPYGGGSRPFEGVQ